MDTQEVVMADILAVAMDTQEVDIAGVDIAEVDIAVAIIEDRAILDTAEVDTVDIVDMDTVDIVGTIINVADTAATDMVYTKIWLWSQRSYVQSMTPFLASSQKTICIIKPYCV